MGDIATLLERAEEKLDRSKAKAFAKKALSGDGFSLEDFRDQLRQIKKLGSMQSILKMLPSVGPFAGCSRPRPTSTNRSSPASRPSSTP
jgi:signal recognition particle subunit SRP54